MGRIRLRLDISTLYVRFQLMVYVRTSFPFFWGGGGGGGGLLQAFQNFHKT